MISAPVPARKSILRRLVSLAVILVLVLVVLFAFAVWNNNRSPRETSRAEFTARLDHAIDTATQWIVQQPDIQGNPPLMFMIGDMAEMSGDPRLQNFAQGYLASPRVRVPGQPVTWYFAHWVDPTVPLPRLTASMMPTLGWQNRRTSTVGECGFISSSSRWISTVITMDRHPNLMPQLFPLPKAWRATPIGTSASAIPIRSAARSY
jgi:hypothetical protein